MKKFIALFLATTSILGCSNSVLANDISLDKAIEIKEAKKNTIQPPQNISIDKNIIITIDDQQLNIKDSAIVYENRVYLPVRELAQALRLSLGYNSEEKITTLNNGEIQLPINQNKAVVKGQIVPIDKENEKVGTIVVNDKTYLPLRFISENLGYKVSYSPSSKIVHIYTNGKVNVNPSEKFETNRQQVTETKMSVEEARKTYKQLSDTIKNYKNVGVTKKYSVSMDFTGSSSSSVDTIIDGKVLLDVKNQPNLYMTENTRTRLISKEENINEEENISQEIFYKDGNLYINQNVDGKNYKYKAEVDSNFNIEDVTTATNLLKDENLITDGKIRKLLDMGKEYISYEFDLDTTKSKDIIIESLKDLNLYDEDLKGIENIKSIHISIRIDDNNMPDIFTFGYQLELKNQDDILNISSIFSNFYGDFNTTKVTLPNEDLSKYENIDE